MRDDIKKLLETRPLWKLNCDTQYKELVAACEYAKAINNHAALDELKNMLEERKHQLLK